ncbi:helix-turn-helix domain-containing protein [Actinomadura kijaniata]|uniref:helix-turn-helix domain-containing protein n=1 Tax=Actinomadura kijaniata TaxID=46161 RepID=UPI00082C2970|nr:helix-turn-helix transcriptional regulator [Actinomadura kijaniata]
MTRRSSQTVRRRRLGAELRRLRESRGISAEDVIRHMDWSASKLSRIETGRIAVLWEAVAALLDFYGIKDGEEREALIRLAREAKQVGWWQPYSDFLSKDYRTYIDLETAASEANIFQPLGVPGLLQTPDYARAVISDAGALDLDDEAIERRVNLRMERQQVLDGDHPLKLWAILDEAALRREIGGRETMKGQLRRLAEVARRPGVTLQVIPFEAGVHASLTSTFGIFRFAEEDEPDVAYIESFAGTLYLERLSEIQAANLTFDHLRATAKSAADSLRLIRAIAEQYG